MLISEILKKHPNWDEAQQCLIFKDEYYIQGGYLNTFIMPSGKISIKDNCIVYTAENDIDILAKFSADCTIIEIVHSNIEATYYILRQLMVECNEEFVWDFISDNTLRYNENIYKMFNVIFLTEGGEISDYEQETYNEMRGCYTGYSPSDFNCCYYDRWLNEYEELDDNFCEYCQENNKPKNNESWLDWIDFCINQHYCEHCKGYHLIGEYHSVIINGDGEIVDKCDREVAQTCFAIDNKYFSSREDAIEYYNKILGGIQNG